MMKTHLNGFICAALAVVLAANATQAAIIKLDLGGGVDPDVVYSGAVLATVSDGNGATTGNQDTGILYGDFLSALPATVGSYSLHNLATSGPAVVVPGPAQQVVQPLSGGDFQIYGPAPANTLLLDVSLATSTSFLSGTMISSTGTVLSVTNGTVVGGSLAPQIVPGSISFSITLSNISGGALVVSSGVLQPFTASATKEIGASQVPEPAAAMLLLLGAIPVWVCRRRCS